MNKKYKKPSQIRAYLSLSYYFFRAQTRNLSTLAFGFLFPIVFISVFGLIGGQGQEITLGIPNNAPKEDVIIKTVEKQDFIKIERDSESALRERLIQGKIAGVLEVEEIGEKINVHITTSAAQPQQNGILLSALGSIVDKTNLKLSNITDPPVSLKQDEVSGREFRYIDFVLPGQIGFALLSTAIFGTVFGLIYLKKALVLKRMFSTPTKPLTVLTAQGTSRWIMAILQTMLILGVGVFVFNFYLPHGLITLLDLMILSSIGLAAFLGFGYFMAGIANDENSAGPLVNLITLPQFLLSGTFFPIENLPEWLQPIAGNLPLSYFNEAVRTVTTEGGTLFDTLPYLAGLLAWGVVMYLLAARTFKWE